MTIRVVLADDHGVVRDGLRVLLEGQSDMRVVGSVATGPDAVRAVAQATPDVAVLDLAMPEMDGIEATWEIRQQSPATQVVILSIYDTPEHVSRALQAGARGYVAKECAGEEVIAAVRAVHAGRRYLSSRVSERLVDEYMRQQCGGGESEAPLSRLSPRERQVLRLVADGRTSQEIAEILSLSPKTVETYRSRTMRKLQLPNLAALVKYALRHGLTSPQ